jgi:F420-non-reducing hydrogenase iron-sulfur subunit
VVRQLLDLSGIGSDRIQIRWVSAAEGQLFADTVTELDQVIANSGPFVAEEFQSQLGLVESVLNSPRLRWLAGMDRQLTQRENVFHEKISEDRFRQLLEGTVQVEYQKALILGALKKGPLSVSEMAAATGLAVYTISIRLGDLEKSGLADLYAFEGTTPRFLKVAV